MLGVSTDDINNKIRLFSALAWLLIIAGLLVFVWFLFQGRKNMEELQLHLIGDFLGGSVASLWALAGIFFIYVAFLGQSIQIRFQKEELKHSIEELRSNREELKAQRIQLERQTELYDFQFKESSFYNLLTNHANLVNGLEIYDGGNLRKGKFVLRAYYKEFWSDFSTKQDDSNGIGIMDVRKDCFRRLVKQRDFLFSYFDSLSLVIKEVSEMKIEENYLNIIATHMTIFERKLLEEFVICYGDTGGYFYSLMNTELFRRGLELYENS
ncbi:MAG: hypothetical protein H6606_10340 [Flavobacteriales bacterium]|nr:hypothetical protein [Flavobacteriales bacterium]